MKILGLEQTMRLWDRLEREAREYYRTGHDARNQLLGIGPVRYSDTELKQIFSDLLARHRRLKSRFIVMAVIGRELVAPGIGYRSISDLALGMADQVIGLGEVQAILQRESDNVRIR